MAFEGGDEIESATRRLRHRKGYDPLNDVICVTRLDALEDVILEFADKHSSLVVFHVFESLSNTNPSD